MGTLTQLQKDILLQWATICKKHKSLDVNLCFYYYTDDREAFIHFDNEEYKIPYDLKDDWLDMFINLRNEGTIKYASKPYGNEVMRNFLFKFVSLDALEAISKTINS